MEPPRPISICSHLLAKPANDFHLWFSGKGMECCWVCSDCAKADEQPDPVAAPDELLEEIANDGCWDGIRGQPGIPTRNVGLSFFHCPIAWEWPPAARWADVQADPSTTHSWIVLLESGELARFLPDSGELITLFSLGDMGFPIGPAVALRVSPAGDFAAVYQVDNWKACVFDLRSGDMTACIGRGDYRPETSHFPLTFFPDASDGRTLLVAATAWNRLDIIDPTDGSILTPREYETPAKQGERPAHYLDYFHAGLLISPDSKWIADNGWVWGPAGWVRTWSLETWKDNVWESEDGPSVKEHPQKWYFWDGPICWIDDTSLAIWGWGEDDLWLLPAVQIFDVRSGEEKLLIPGVEVRKSKFPRRREATSLFFDEFIFSTNGESGLSVWDPTDGARVHQEPDMNPIQYHPRSKVFLSITDDGIRLSKLTK